MGIEILLIVFGGYFIHDAVTQEPKPKAAPPIVQELTVEERKAIVTIDDGLVVTEHESSVLTQVIAKQANETVSVAFKEVRKTPEGYLIKDLSGN